MSKDKLEFKVRLKNQFGLHIRPAALLAKLIRKSRSQVTLDYKGEKANAKSIMSVINLAIPKNGIVKICVQGEDAKKTLTSLVDAFNREFKGI